MLTRACRHCRAKYALMIRCHVSVLRYVERGCEARWRAQHAMSHFHDEDAMREVLREAPSLMSPRTRR